jgi:radical SAM protein with 4Fe4S-binding SPASM domain
VTSYPEYFFGNIFESDNLTDLLKHSPARQKFLDRPSVNIQQDCLECDYLSICHGGCPVRTYTFSGTLFEKDPYCHLYKSLFRHIEEVAATLARGRAINPGWKALATGCGSCASSAAAPSPALVQLESSWSAAGGARLRELPVLQ